MSVPAHKVVGDVGKPGQIQYSFDREPYLKHSNVAPDVTLSDYIARKTECCGNPLRGCQDCPPPEKITFNEWLDEYYPSAERPDDPNYYFIVGLIAAWQAALTRGVIKLLRKARRIGLGRKF